MMTAASVTPDGSPVNLDAAAHRYWLRAYHRAERHLHHAAAAYSHVIACHPEQGWCEWETWQSARRRAAYTAAQVRRVMGW